MRAQVHSWFCEPWCSRVDRRCRLGDVQPPLMKRHPIPPGQKVPAKLTVFLLNVKNEFVKSYIRQSQWGGNGSKYFFIINNQFQLCNLYIVKHASGADNSPASGLMRTSSPVANSRVSAAPNTCRLFVPQLKYTLYTLWHEGYNNAIWGAAKSIMRCYRERWQKYYILSHLSTLTSLD